MDPEFLTLECLVISREKLSGFSSPLLVQCGDGFGAKKRRDIVLKFTNKIFSRELGRTAEFVAHAIAVSLGVKIPRCCGVSVSNDVLSVARDSDVFRSRLGESGLHWGSEYLLGSTVYRSGVVTDSDFMGRELVRIWAFDLLIQNFDRQADNPNLLFSGGELYVIDHERAFRKVFSPEADISFHWQHALVSDIDINIFTSECFRGFVNEFASKWSVIKKWILDNIPVQWNGADSGLGEIVKYLDSVAADPDSFLKMAEENGFIC